MKGSQAIIEMLNKYDVKHVFGLIGETTFPLYETWDSIDKVRHIFGRDERNLAIMAEAYARVTGKPGVFEVPGVGASYTLPGVSEAFISGTPIIELSSDVSTYSEKKNFLTEYDKELMFRGVTKETFNVTQSRDIPRYIRRAFRTATTGPTGPVFMRFPLDVYEGEVDEGDIYAQTEFSSYPSIRLTCDDSRIEKAIRLITQSSRPVIICGQGILYSGAGKELVELSEALKIPVGTTISGKGAFPETHPLSIGVVGSRGGTDFSTSIINSADLIFFVATNTDSASTSTWKLPGVDTKATLIQLDVSEKELGNNYNVNLCLLGDAKLILSRMLSMVASKGTSMTGYEGDIEAARSRWEKKLGTFVKLEEPVDPITFVKGMEEYIDRISAITADPGVGAIYTSAYMKCNSAGRKFIFNYSVGGLGYAVPAAIGAAFGSGKMVTCLTTDGSLSFNEGELETVAREELPIKLFVFNNGSYGWIRATMVSDYGRVLKGTQFYPVNYEYIAKAYGLDYYTIDRTSEVHDTMRRIYSDDKPSMINVRVLPEDKLLPPVPEWKHIASDGKTPYLG